MKFKESPYIGHVDLVLKTADNKSFVTEPVKKLTLTLAGIPGDRHAGFHKSAGVRETELFKKGMPIANHRQWSAVSVEELASIAKKMKVKEVEPSYLGANLLISGIPSFTQLPPLTRLRIGEGHTEVTLVVYEENHPCKHPGEALKQAGLTPQGEGFVKAAYGSRGLVGWVENGGKIQQGDAVKIFIPEQWPDSMLKPWFP
ncbi:MAG: hypothetical protein RL226_2038 [Bacteroidota bacterium]|jgi:MOSC domain-containing protein YiiM